MWAVEPFAVAQLYAVRGDGDRAFLWLDRAYQQRDSAMVTVKLTSHLANIRGDPRYKALLRKMRLPE